MNDSAKINEIAERAIRIETLLIKYVKNFETVNKRLGRFNTQQGR